MSRSVRETPDGGHGAADDHLPVRPLPTEDDGDGDTGTIPDTIVSRDHVPSGGRRPLEQP